MHDTYFWCDVTLVCVRVDAFAVDWGQNKVNGRAGDVLLGRGVALGSGTVSNWLGLFWRFRKPMACAWEAGNALVVHCSANMFQDCKLLPLFLKVDHQDLDVLTSTQACIGCPHHLSMAFPRFCVDLGALSSLPGGADLWSWVRENRNSAKDSG